LGLKLYQLARIIDGNIDRYLAVAATSYDGPASSMSLAATPRDFRRIIEQLKTIETILDQDFGQSKPGPHCILGLFVGAYRTNGVLEKPLKRSLIGY
jgi:hypothetical protein